MDIMIFVGVLILLQLICLVISKMTAAGVKSQTDYFLAGKKVSFFPLLMTFIATQIGGGLVLGSSEESYKFGWAVLIYPLGQCLGFVVLALGVGKRMAQFNVSTVAQLFEEVYQSPRLKRVASALSILSLFMIFVAQLIASKKFMLSFGLESNTLFVIFWILVVSYTVLGGLEAVIVTDIIQATFFIVVFATCLGYALFLSDQSAGEMVLPGWNSPQFDFNSTNLVGWLLMPLLFMIIEQDMAQRCFAAKSDKAVSRSAAWAAVLTFLISAIPIFFGIIGKQQGIEVLPGSSVLMTVVQETTTPALAALVACAVFAAIISTADSLINAISSNLTQDFAFFQTKDKQNLRTSQLVTAGIACLGILISFYFSNIVDLLIQSYELAVSCLLVPVLGALILKGKKGNELSALLAIILGAVGFGWFQTAWIGIPKEIVSIGLSLLGFGLGEAISLLRRKRLFFYEKISASERTEPF
jgi:solute:Na+ symporter, SSS family